MAVLEGGSAGSAPPAPWEKWRDRSPLHSRGVWAHQSWPPSPPTTGHQHPASAAAPGLPASLVTPCSLGEGAPPQHPEGQRVWEQKPAAWLFRNVEHRGHNSKPKGARGPLPFCEIPHWPPKSSLALPRSLLCPSAPQCSVYPGSPGTSNRQGPGVSGGWPRFPPPGCLVSSSQSPREEALAGPAQLRPGRGIPGRLPGGEGPD